VSELYAERLQREGVIPAGFLGEQVAAFNAHLEEHFDAAKTYMPIRPTGSAAAGAASTSRWTPKALAATCPPASNKSCSTALAAR
jgi:hypothetical protein